MAYLKQLLICAFFLTATADWDDQNDAPMPKLLSEGQDISVKKGETLRLHCGIEFDKDAYVVMWRNGSDFITAEKTVMKYTDKIKVHNNGINLEIDNVQPEDTGRYTCSISSNPRVSQTHSVNVVYLENLEIEPKSGFIDVKAGSKMKLKCMADANPKPNLQWFYNGKPVEKVKIRDSTAELTRDDVKPHDAGTYECIVEDQFGTRLNKSIRVNVIASAQVMKKPENGKISVMTGDDVKLNCQIDGQGQMKIHWYFKDQQLSGKSGEELQLENAQYSDAGTYKCKVMTEVFNNMEANFSVEVLHSPRIICNNLHIHTGEGRTIDITCIVTANPEPTVIWIRHNHTLIDSHKIRITRDLNSKKYTLKVNNIKHTDVGLYIISAKNDIGMETKDIILTVLPSIVVINIDGEAEINTNITFASKSFSPILYFELRYRQLNARQNDWQMLTIPAEPSNIIFTQQYILRCLQVGAEYEIAMSAVNKYGSSHWSHPLKLFIKDSRDNNCMLKDSLQAPSSSSSSGSEAAAVESAPTSVPDFSPPIQKAASLVSILTIVVLVIFFW